MANAIHIVAKMVLSRCHSIERLSFFRSHIPPKFLSPNSRTKKRYSSAPVFVFPLGHFTLSPKNKTNKPDKPDDYNGKFSIDNALYRLQKRFHSPFILH